MNNFSGKPRNASFSAYLRTGRIVTSRSVQVKFNPWHDPDDGRFTFAGGGIYSGGAAGAAPTARYAKRPTQAEVERRARDRALSQNITDADRAQKEWQRKLVDPKNFSSYVVKPGDNLSKIAKTRRGLSPSDLAWLNSISEQGVLQVGQVLRLPTQDFLESNKETHKRGMALMFYMAMNDGKLPPDTAHPPTIQQQIDSNLRTVVLNGYSYQVDVLDRPRIISGDVPENRSEQRSRSTQLAAGGDERLPTDDGGHYVDLILGGSPHPINHFAQDSRINRGVYRDISKTIRKDRDAGHNVALQIVPHLLGLKVRPDKIIVTWYVDGERYSRTVPNQRQGK